ncbi:arginyl-tRNA--protein transferase 1-like isoform X2 [Lineus longissimus]|uniref:arginyl-tRNA--protein transferase 1-like isoform X2 n=1 Tax=Lineus longissimus TaxID=88925 RepID=UPI00315D0858
MAGAARGEPCSIVEYLGGNEGHRCGYCGKSNTNLSLGFWAHSLTVQDYQDLIDRGWRRSGKYCYKPTMNKTCCPQYTIRQDPLNFKISSSQKKALKMVNRYINDDKKHGEGVATSSTGGSEQASNSKPRSQSQDKEKVAKPNAGPDPTKPPCKKAKVLRMEKKAQKLAQKGVEISEAKVKVTKPDNRPKSIEDFLQEVRDDPSHKLEIKLVRSSMKNREFLTTMNESYNVYKRYQMTIHKDSDSDCDKRGYINFLVDSPLESLDKPGGPSHGYGSFHQQYWLDGTLIMVGVIDILANSVSSVYLYYNPDFGFLSPGTYSALREIEFTRSLHKIDPQITHYYMGFYIHSCPKMRYKGQYEPSFLLCPEVYSWHPIPECRPKLDASTYSRFAEQGKVDENAITDDLSEVSILFERQQMTYDIYLAVSINPDTDQVKEYAKLVGKKCAERMLLYRK